MYSTKRLSEKVCDSYTSIGDPYVKKGVTLSRHTGKQFQTQPAKLPAGGQGYFAKIPYKPEPFVDRTMYLTSQPLEKRKAGFGTKDASRKDEFTSTVRVQQFREQLRRELDTTDRRLLSTTPSSMHESQDAGAAAASESAGGSATLSPAARAARLLCPSSRVYGHKCQQPAQRDKVQHGRRATTAEFYDRGHMA